MSLTFTPLSNVLRTNHERENLTNVVTHLVQILMKDSAVLTGVVSHVEMSTLASVFFAMSVSWPLTVCVKCLLRAWSESVRVSEILTGLCK